jgi:glycosyltransferase involved in cell wall biosynthesis
MTIGGSGRLGHYRAETERLGIADRVQFTGWVDEEVVHRLLERADVLVLPSRFEGLPIAVIEAMAFGLAVVVTPVGAVPEVIRDGEEGILVPVGDPRILAKALTRLARDPALRQHLGRNARNRFTKDFDLEVYHQRLTQLYRRYMLAD